MKKLTLFLGMAVVVIAFLLVLVLLLDSMRWVSYVEVLAPPRDISEQEKVLREKLNYQEKNADELKTLVSLLLGLSTLYGLALGVGSYINVQEAKGRADETLDRLNRLEDKIGQRVQQYEDRLEKQEKEYQRKFEAELKRFGVEIERNLDDIRREFPLFRNMQGSIRKISNSLQQFIPDAEYGRDVFGKIDLNDRVMIEHYERAIGAFEFFELRLFSRDASRIYNMLGSYYSHKYGRENAEYTRASKTGTAPDRADVARARLYLSYARDIETKNIAALNELAFLEVVVAGEPERAVPFLTESLNLDPEQQRARYFLAIVMHIKGNEARSGGNRVEAVKDYQESDNLLTKALVCTRWQAVPEPERYRRAMYYNRACARTRLAELAGSEAEKIGLFRKAIDDLNETFPLGQQPDEQRKRDFAGDVAGAGDFVELLNRPEFKVELETIRKRAGV